VTRIKQGQNTLVIYIPYIKQHNSFIKAYWSHQFTFTNGSSL